MRAVPDITPTSLCRYLLTELDNEALTTHQVASAVLDLERDTGLPRSAFWPPEDNRADLFIVKD